MKTFEYFFLGIFWHIFLVFFVAISVMLSAEKVSLFSPNKIFSFPIIEANSQFHQHFTKKLLRRYSFSKKFQSQNLRREKLHKTHLNKKVVHKMLMKLTPRHYIPFMDAILVSFRRTYLDWATQDKQKMLLIIGVFFVVIMCNNFSIF